MIWYFGYLLLSSVFQVDAIDKDSEKFGPVRYTQLIGAPLQEVLTIDFYTGVIRCCLDKSGRNGQNIVDRETAAGKILYIIPIK